MRLPRASVGFALALLALAAAAPPVVAQGKNELYTKNVDDATAAAYQKIGASFVMLRGHNRPPMICFDTKFDLTKQLPQVPVPFGLHVTPDAGMTDEGMKQLAHLDKLAHLHLIGRNITVTGEGLKHLKGMKHLKRLEFPSERIDDKVLRVLREIGLLHTLYPAGTNMAELDRKEAKNFWDSPKEVTVYVLWQTRVTDEGLKEFEVFENLAKLHVMHTPVTGSGLAKLAKLKKLTHLWLHKAKADDAGMKGVGALKNLTSLQLDSTKVTDAGLKELAGLEKLTRLYVTTSEVSDDGLAHLAGLKNLTALDMRYSNVEGPGLKHLAGMKGLVALHLYGSKATGKGLKHLAGLKIDYLRLSHSKLNDEGMAEVALLKHLTSLDLADNEKLTDAGMKHLAGLKGLRKLDLSETKITSAGLKHLAGLEELTDLRLGYNEKITDDGLEHLAGLKNLRYLSLSKTKVTGDGVAKLRKSLPKCGIFP